MYCNNIKQHKTIEVVNENSTAGKNASITLKCFPAISTTNEECFENTIRPNWRRAIAFNPLHRMLQHWLLALHHVDHCEMGPAPSDSMAYYWQCSEGNINQVRCENETLNMVDIMTSLCAYCAVFVVVVMYLLAFFFLYCFSRFIHLSPYPIETNTL